MKLTNDRGNADTEATNKHVSLTWPNSFYKHPDHIPYLQQSMDIGDFGIDSLHNDSHEIGFYNSWDTFRSKQLSHELMDIRCMPQYIYRFEL